VFSENLLALRKSNRKVPSLGKGQLRLAQDDNR